MDYNLSEKTTITFRYAGYNENGFRRYRQRQPVRRLQHRANQFDQNNALPRHMCLPPAW